MRDLLFGVRKIRNLCVVWCEEDKRLFLLFWVSKIRDLCVVWFVEDERPIICVCCEEDKIPVCCSV